MKNYTRKSVTLTGGYLFEKQELNRKITVNSVYDRFKETGRIDAFRFEYKEGDEIVPHVFWDSDVAKWMEGAAYILAEHKDAELEAKVDELVALIKKNQCEDGYFNIYFTVVEPAERFKKRSKHELYCAGHLMEAAVAISECLGKRDMLECMERYADYIYKVFVEERSAAFVTPGHEEIELALIRMYCHTGKKKYLDLAEFFINKRGTLDEKSNQVNCEYCQSHIPVREQREALGHSVRAMYLYTGMARLAKHTNDAELMTACKALFEDTTEKKMYVTGGLGSTNIGEAFTTPYDLPNDGAYTETCAGIGLMFFAHAMQELENDSKYADAIERVLYNGVLSGLSLDGKSFFYENPLEINLSERFENTCGKRRFPANRRVECFSCSCCPPNVVRLLPSIQEYVYGVDGDTLFVNQYISSKLSSDSISCVMSTDYPRENTVSIKANGIKSVALRIPFWCDSFTLNKLYKMNNGYAVVECDGGDIEISFDMPAKAVWANVNVLRDAGRICIMKGPVVYCAEAVDNKSNLHRYSIAPDLEYKVIDDGYGLPSLEVNAYETLESSGSLYSSVRPEKVRTKLKLIPYNAFANREACDMAVWFREE